MGSSPTLPSGSDVNSSFVWSPSRFVGGPDALFTGVNSSLLAFSVAPLSSALTSGHLISRLPLSNKNNASSGKNQVRLCLSAIPITFKCVLLKRCTTTHLPCLTPAPLSSHLQPSSLGRYCPTT